MKIQKKSINLHLGIKILLFFLEKIFSKKKIKEIIGSNKPKLVYENLESIKKIKD